LQELLPPTGPIPLHARGDLSPFFAPHRFPAATLPCNRFAAALVPVQLLEQRDGALDPLLLRLQLLHCVTEFHHKTARPTRPASRVLGSDLLAIQTPPTPWERDFNEELLIGLGTVLPAGLSSTALRHRSRIAARQLEVRMLIIDEIHSMLAGTFRDQRIFLNSIRFLANDLRIPWSV
jgi:hypothetical protein